MSDKGRVMAIDFGMRRVGIALSDSLRMTAFGFETISWNGVDDRYMLDRIAQIIDDNDVTTIIIGQPNKTNGTQGSATQKVMRFAEHLSSVTLLKPVFVDERYTTVIASQYLKNTKRNSREKRQVVDQVAAEIILKDYLESHRM